MNANPVPENPENDADAPPAPVTLDIDMATAREAAESSGMAVINQSAMFALGEIGIRAGNYGLAKIAAGALICSMQSANEMQTLVLNIAKRPKVSDKTVISCAIAHAALTKSIQGSVLGVNASGLASQQVKKPVRKVFGPPKVIPKLPDAAVG